MVLGVRWKGDQMTSDKLTQSDYPIGISLATPGGEHGRVMRCRPFVDGVGRRGVAQMVCPCCDGTVLVYYSVEDAPPHEARGDAMDVILAEMRASGDSMAAYWAGRIKGVSR
jgi:hypothetical protein